jgi:hypothetical protein
MPLLLILIALGAGWELIKFISFRKVNVNPATKVQRMLNEQNAKQD